MNWPPWISLTDCSARRNVCEETYRNLFNWLCGFLTKPNCSNHQSMEVGGVFDIYKSTTVDKSLPNSAFGAIAPSFCDDNYLTSRIPPFLVPASIPKQGKATPLTALRWQVSRCAHTDSPADQSSPVLWVQLYLAWWFYPLPLKQCLSSFCYKMRTHFPQEICLSLDKASFPAPLQLKYLSLYCGM